MKAVVFSDFGPSSVLRLEDRPVPEPGPGEVRVRIAVSGVNPTDWKSRSTRGFVTGDFEEHIPNQDGAGIVDAVGEGVDGFTRGDRVWTYIAAFKRSWGTAAEFTLVPAERLVRLPDGVSFEVGASLGVPAMTAHRALTVHDAGPERLAPGALEGRTVLVAGGAGAVGRAAIQLARWAGAQVITTVSSEEKASLAAAAGAHHVINYRTEDTAARIREIAPGGVDQIVEVAPGPNADLNSKVLASHGCVAVYANEGSSEMTLDIRTMYALNVRYQFLILYLLSEEAFAHATADITAALQDGFLAVGEDVGLPVTLFGLEQTDRAHDAVQNGTVGKVLISVAAL